MIWLKKRNKIVNNDNNLLSLVKCIIKLGAFIYANNDKCYH